MGGVGYSLLSSVWKENTNYRPSAWAHIVPSLPNKALSRPVKGYTMPALGASFGPSPKEGGEEDVSYIGFLLLLTKKCVFISWLKCSAHDFTFKSNQEPCSHLRVAPCCLSPQVYKCSPSSRTPSQRAVPAATGKSRTATCWRPWTSTGTKTASSAPAATAVSERWAPRCTPKPTSSSVGGTTYGKRKILIFVS